MRAPAGGVAAKSGEDALLTCVVLGARGKPVLWKRARDLQVLTAGGVRVTRDERIQVLHDDCEYNCYEKNTFLFYIFRFVC